MATTKWFPNFYCRTMDNIKIKTHCTTLLQRTMLYSLNVFSHLTSIRVVFNSDGLLALRLTLICTSLCVRAQS